MPTTTTAETLCGPRPAPHTMAFLRWCDEYISRRKRQCVFKRPTIYYVAANGNDSNNGTSPSTPWQTYAKVISHIGANSDGNYSILFRRGDTFRSATGLSLTAPNVHFGAYGPLPTSGIDAPIISHFTVQWASGGTRWSLVSGNVWQASVTAGTTTNPSGATSVGFIRVAEDPLSPLIAQPGAAQVGLNDLSFAVSGSTVYINVAAYGVTSPNDLNIEAVPVNASSPPDAIALFAGSAGNPGSTNCWIDGLRFEGWGAGSQGLTATGNANASGVRNMAGGDAGQSEHVAYISNCECYYYGAHAFSQEPGGFGGAHIVENCIAGYGYDAINGLTMFNSYAGNGRQETVYRNCSARFGALPQQIGTGGRTVAFGSSTAGSMFYGHTAPNPTQAANLVLIMNCEALDERDSSLRATCIGNDLSMANTDDAGAGPLNTGLSLTDPAAQRVFFIGYRNSVRSDTTTKTPILATPYAVYINCHFFVRRNWSRSPDALAYALRNWRTYCINCVFELEDLQGDRCALFENTNSGFSTDARLMNCLILFRGHATDQNGEDQFQLHGPNGDDKFRLANSIVISQDRVFNAVSGKRVSLRRISDFAGPSNSTNTLRNVAVAGVWVNDGNTATGNWIGFNNATGLVNLETSSNIYPDPGSFSGDVSSGRKLLSGRLYTLDPAPQNPLAGAGSANPFSDKSDMLPAPEYDFFGRRRPATPSIGPVDVINTSSGGGSSGISGGRAIVRSPVRPAAG